MKRTLALLLALATLLLCVGCAAKTTDTTADTTAKSDTPAEAGTENTADAAQKPKKVAFICKSYTDTFYLNVKNEFEKEAEEYTDLMTVEFFDGAMDSTKMNNTIETCIANQFDAILFQYVDAAAQTPAAQAAAEAGIIVIAATGKLDDGGASHYVDANPLQQGTFLAEYAIETGACDNAEVAILRGVAGNSHAEGRFEGFKNVLGAKDDVTIVADEIANWSKEEAMAITQNWLVAYPDLDVIFASCDDMAFGAYEAVKLADKLDQVKIFAIDGTAAGLKALKDGMFEAEVMQNPVDYASTSMDILVKLLKGEEADSVLIDSALITPDNVDDYLK